MPDDREKKSWRDIDRQRDQSSHAGRREKKQKEQAGSSAALNDYKRQLNAFFDRGEKSTAIKSMIESEAPTSTPEPKQEQTTEGAGQKKGGKRKAAAKKTTGSNRQVLIRKILKSESPGEANDLVNQFIEAGFEFPDDFEVLGRAVEHDDIKVVLKVLRQMAVLAGTTPNVPRRSVLLMRLDGIALGFGDPEVEELVTRIKAKL